MQQFLEIRFIITGHLIGSGKKNQKLRGNFQAYMYYAEKYVDYVENTLDLRKFKQFIPLIIVSFHCVSVM